MVVATVLLALAAAGCSGGTASTTPTTRAPLPAGPNPSSISKQVCAKEARHDIAEVLGETATVSTPTWRDHQYACRYVYPSGSMELAVKELSSWAQTKAYFRSLGVQMGQSRTLKGLGQAAFQTTNGSMVVRKDWKVLLVDTSTLPAQFGVPPTSSADVAVTVSDVILGCWAGD